MQRSEKIYELLYSIFIKWFKRNKGTYFGYGATVDADELFNKIITMDQHLIDPDNMFLKWEKILEKSGIDDHFEFYMKTVFKNSVIQFFRDESTKIKTVSGEFAEIIIEETPGKSEDVITNFEIIDLCEKITQSLQEDIKKDHELRKILELVSLYYLEGETLDDISKATGINISKVYRDIQKALKYIRDNIRKHVKTTNNDKIEVLFNENEKKIFARLISLSIGAEIDDRREKL